MVDKLRVIIVIINPLMEAITLVSLKPGSYLSLGQTKKTLKMLTTLQILEIMEEISITHAWVKMICPIQDL